MAHIHLEDGSFTLFWVIVWWALALLIIGAALYLIRRQRIADPRRVTMAAFCVAAAFVLSQVELPIPGGAVHISLTPLIGILTGPVAGVLIVFIINILDAAIGHGGWGMIGANTLVGLSEVLVAYGIWRGLKPFIGNVFVRAVTATLCGLILGNFVMMGLIVLSGIQGVNQTPEQIITGLFLVASVNTAVAVIEAVITGLVVAYFGKMRPDLLDGEQE
jgi:cobalt/nickel transport system permease protein